MRLIQFCICDYFQMLKKGGREVNSGKKKGLKILTSAEGKEGSTETCVSVRKELLHDSRA